MNSVGIDLHKQTISLCVVNQGRQVVARRRFPCSEPEKIRAYLETLRPFQMVVEATASYEWLFRLLEPLAEKAVLAHPKKLRVIAESTRKADKLAAGSGRCRHGENRRDDPQQQTPPPCTENRLTTLSDSRWAGKMRGER
jgi:hypothetical protein